MKKTHKVVMLPTNEKESRLALQPLNNKLELYYNAFNENGSRHLYIISDDEIKEGDWYMSYNAKTKEYTISKADTKFNEGNNPNNIDKRSFVYEYWNKTIVATTDESISRNSDIKMSIKDALNTLPQLPESFIQAYIKAYNEGNPITEVALEMELHKWLGSSYPVGHRPTYQLKLRQDNTVIIHQSKMYTHQEVVTLCMRAYHKATKDGKDAWLGTFDKWVQDNL